MTLKVPSTTIGILTTVFWINLLRLMKLSTRLYFTALEMYCRGNILYRLSLSVVIQN